MNSEMLDIAIKQLQGLKTSGKVGNVSLDANNITGDKVNISIRFSQNYESNNVTFNSSYGVSTGAPANTSDK